jgi:hypothetical protein
MADLSHSDMNTIALAIFSAGLSFSGAWFFMKRREAAVLRTRVEELERTVALMGQAVTPINTMMQALLVKELTHIHTPEMDALLVKVGPPNTLTSEEEERLAYLLKERSEDMSAEIPDSERGAALILPAIMERAKTEQEATAAKVTLVAVLTKAEEPQ